MRSRSFDDAQRAHDLAQVDRHRLAARDGENRTLLDLALERIDGRIERDDALGKPAVALGERIDRVGDLLFGKPAHLGHHAGQVLQIDVEGFRGVMFSHDFLSSAEAAGDVVLGALVVRDW